MIKSTGAAGTIERRVEGLLENVVQQGVWQWRTMQRRGKDGRGRRARAGLRARKVIPAGPDWKVRAASPALRASPDRRASQAREVKPGRKASPVSAAKPARAAKRDLPGNFPRSSR